MYKYNKTNRKFTEGNSSISISLVIAEETNLSYDDKSRNYCFLYDDITALDFGPTRFIEINSVEVVPSQRMKGIGTKLINLVKESYPDIPIFARAGILYEDDYLSLKSYLDIKDYIYENVVPFYESNGFVDVNDTILHHEQTVIMCYPKSLAQKYIDEANSVKEERERERAAKSISLKPNKVKIEGDVIKADLNINIPLELEFSLKPLPNNEPKDKINLITYDDIPRKDGER